MIIITSLSELDEIPVSPALLHFLRQQLIHIPLGYTEQADEAWKQLDNHLVLLEADEGVDTLLSNVTFQHLRQILEFPEYILQAPDNYCLTLTITDQAGSGLYLLYPNNISCPQLQALTRWADKA